MVSVYRNKTKMKFKGSALLQGEAKNTQGDPYRRPQAPFRVLLIGQHLRSKRPA